MIKSSLTATSLLFLLSTAAAAQTPPAGTAGATGTSGTKPPETAPAAPRSTSAPADYRLVSGDKLRVEVYKDPQLSQSLQIRPDGKITLPLVGDLPAAGRTSTQLRDEITTALKSYVKAPEVTVIVVETMPQTIAVMGEVASPGNQPVMGEISIIQALATAGGFTEWAKKGSVKVLRQGPAGMTTLEFNYNDAVNGKAKILMLRAGDTVIVR